MTDEQIEAALNACTFGYLREKCKNCPLDSEKEPCITNLHLAALAYIRRLKHRAEVAERALENACVVILSSRNGDQPRRLRAYYKAYLEAAEKELAEESNVKN